jgi:hypothetical protein
VVKGVRQVFKCSDLTSQKLQEIEELNKCYNAAPANPASKQQRDPPKRKGKQAATLKADWESPSESDEDFPPVGSSTYKLKPFAAVGYEQAMPSRCPPPKKKANPTSGRPPSTTIHTPGHAELCENSTMNKGLKGAHGRS